MDQGGRAQGVPGVLRGHPSGREVAQLVVDERKQAGRRLAIAGRYGVHEVGDLGHESGLYGMRRELNTEPLGLVVVGALRRVGYRPYDTIVERRISVRGNSGTLF